MILFKTFGRFIVFTLFGVPLVYGLLLYTAGMIWFLNLGHPLTSVFLSYIGGVEPFVLIAVPQYMLAREVLSRGGVGMRIVTFATKLLGFLPGGFGIATTTYCLIFDGVSGSAIADTAAIGSVMVPALKRSGTSAQILGNSAWLMARPHAESEPTKQADLGLDVTMKQTRKRQFLAVMERVVPWAAFVELITPYAPESKRSRPLSAVETMLRIHFMQQWFTLSDPAMEEALHDLPLFREFANLGWDTRLPDETTILRFRRLLEDQKLAP